MTEPKKEPEKKEPPKPRKSKKHYVLLGLRFSGQVIKAIVTLSIKTATFFCLLIVVLAALSWILFIKFFNAQQVTQTMAREAQRVLDRPVIIESMELKFFNSVKIDGFKILDDDQGSNLVEAQSVILNYSPWPLLHREVHIESIVLKNPRIVITRDADGNFNVPPIKIHAPALTEAGQPDNNAQPFKITIDDWEIDNGTFILRDLQNNTTHSVYQVNAKFKSLDFNNPSSFTADFTARNSWQDKIVEAAVSLQGKVNFAGFKWQQFSLRNTSAKVDFFKKPVMLTFDFDNLKNPFISVTAKTPALEDADLSMFIKKPLGISFPAAEINLNANIKNYYRQISVNKMQVKAADVNAQAGGNITLADKLFNADFNLKTDSFNLADKDKIYPRLKQYALQGAADINIKGSYKNGKFDLPLIEANVRNAGAKLGTLNGGWNISGATGNLYLKNNSDIMGTKITNGALTLGRQQFSAVQGFCEYSSSKNKLNGFVEKALLNNVPMKISADITHFRNNKTRQITTRLYMQNFDVLPFYQTVEDFVLAIAQPPKNPQPPPVDNSNLAWLHFFKRSLPTFMPNINGSIFADNFSSSVLSGKDFETEFDIKDMLPGMAQLNGKIDARMTDGVIYQLEKKAEEEKVLGIAFQPFIVMHRMEKAGTFKANTVLKDVRYQTISLSTDFENGRMTINNFYSDGHTLGVTARGAVNWPAEDLDLTFWTIFRNISRSGALAENLTDASGAPALAFRVHDKMGNPKVDMLKPKTSGDEIKKSVSAGLRTNFDEARNFRLSENDINKLTGKNAQ